MKQGEPRPVECAICGEMFEARSNQARYCPECRAIKVQEKKDRKFHSVDSPEKIAICLNCKRKTCTGSCFLVN